MFVFKLGEQLCHQLVCLCLGITSRQFSVIAWAKVIVPVCVCACMCINLFSEFSASLEGNKYNMVDQQYFYCNI